MIKGFSQGKGVLSSSDAQLSEMMIRDSIMDRISFFDTQHCLSDVTKAKRRHRVAKYASSYLKFSWKFKERKKHYR